MAARKIRSIKGRVMRLTRLDECGAPMAGECSTIVTDGFVSITLSNEEETGEEFTQKNAWGDFCIAEKDADRVKWINVSIQMCEVDPAVLDLVGGANLITDGTGDAIGATFGREPNPNSFAIEVWTKKAGTDACAPGGGTQEWGYFVVPFVKNGKLDGDLTIENGPLTLGLAGEGQGANAEWAEGPYGDAPLGGPFPEGDLWGMAVTTAQPPDVTEGCVPLDGATATVTTVAPATGPAAGGTALVITGTGLTGATGVTFGGVAGTAFSVVNATTINVTAPAHAAGAVNVVVAHPDGNVTKTNGYTYT